MKTKTLKIERVGNGFFAGEFSAGDALYCAAHVPTVTGAVWQLEKRITVGKFINDWVTVPARFLTDGNTLRITF